MRFRRRSDENSSKVLEEKYKFKTGVIVALIGALSAICVAFIQYVLPLLI